MSEDVEPASICATSLPYTHGNLSVVVPMDDFKIICRSKYFKRCC